MRPREILALVGLIMIKGFPVKPVPKSWLRQAPIIIIEEPQPEFRETFHRQLSLISHNNSTFVERACTDMRLRWGHVFTDEETEERIETLYPELTEKGLQPAISLQDLANYRRLSFVKCIIQKYGRIEVQMDVPVKPTKLDFQVRLLTLLSFEIEIGVCTFDYPTKLFATSMGSRIYRLSDNEYRRCLRKRSCDVFKKREVSLAVQGCLKAVFQGRTGRELIPFCPFHCKPHYDALKERRQEVNKAFALVSWILSP